MLDLAMIHIYGENEIGVMERWNEYMHIQSCSVGFAIKINFQNLLQPQAVIFLTSKWTRFIHEYLQFRM